MNDSREERLDELMRGKRKIVEGFNLSPEQANYDEEMIRKMTGLTNRLGKRITPIEMAGKGIRYDEKNKEIIVNKNARYITDNDDNNSDEDGEYGEISRQEFSKSDILRMERYKPYDLLINSTYSGLKFDNFPRKVQTVHPAELKLIKKMIEFEKFKNIKVDEKLLKLLVFTENTVFKRQLFYPAFFIDADFKFDDRFIVKGILVFECVTIKKEGKIIHVNFAEGIPDDVRILFTVLDKKANDITSFNISFNELTFNTDVFGSEVWYRYLKTYIVSEYKNEKEAVIEVLEGVTRVVCNIIDLIEGNKDELELKLIAPSISQIEKRIKKGKSPVTTTVIIRPKKQLLAYTEMFEKEHRKMKYSHRFVVRGFWRHFKSDYYKEMQGKKIWIRPFLKGSGILIKKEALFTDSNEKQKE